MLDAIRKRSGSIVVKGLLLLLVLSFGIWGVGDYINSGGTDNNAAVVGDIELPAGDIEFQLNQEIQRLGQRFGGSLSPEMVQQLRSMGLVQDVLRRNINQALFTLATQDLGMVVTDDRVRADIQGNDAFRNDLGRFDRQLFEAALRSAGF
ncbi:MAG: SurA N-terminal domain-containing protein, partial [Rhodospirillales bacterium]